MPPEGTQTDGKTDSRLAQLEAENQKLREQMKANRDAKRQQAIGDLPEELEEQVRFRMANGASREQAIQGVKLQLENDALQAKLAEQERKSKKD